MRAFGDRLVTGVAVVIVVLSAALACGCATATDGRFGEFRVLWPRGPTGSWSIQNPPGQVDAVLLSNPTDTEIEQLVDLDIQRITLLRIQGTWLGSMSGLNSISDRGLGLLAQGPRLLVLELEWQQDITADGLRELFTSQPTMLKVVLRYCDRVDKDVLAALVLEFPRLTIEAQFSVEPPEPDSDVETEWPGDE